MNFHYYMRRYLIKFSFGGLILAGLAVNFACGQTASKPEAATVAPSNIDLSTDEAVLTELQKRIDAKSDAPGKKGGRKLDGKSVCIKRLKESEKVIVIGTFRYDYGCHYDGAFVDSHYFERADTALSKKALAAFGWEKAPKREREMLASYWVQKGLLAFSTVLQTKDKDLNANEFHPPRAVTAEDGEIWVTLWIQMPSRMRRGKEFKRVEYRFAKDGSLIVSETNTGT